MVLKSSHGDFAEKIGVKLGIIFSKIPLTPNQWTILSLLPALIGFYYLAVEKNLVYGLICFILSGLLDGVDGGVARVTGAVTNLGAYLDGMMDRFVEALLIIGLMFIPMPDMDVFGYILPMALWLTLLLFFGTCMTTFSRAYADHRKVVTNPKKLKEMGGVLERAERLIFIFVGMVLYIIAGPIWLSLAIVADTLLAFVTVCQRMWFAIKNAE